MRASFDEPALRAGLLRMSGVLAAAAVAAACGGDDGPRYNAAPDHGDPRPSPVLDVPTPDGPFLHDVGFSPDGRWVLARTGGVVTVWELDAARGTLIERGWIGPASRRGGPPPDVPVSGYGDWLDANPQLHAWALTPDGQELIGVGEALIARWRLHPAKKQIATLVDRGKRDAEVSGIALSPDGRRLLVAGRDRVVAYAVDGLDERGAARLPDDAEAAAFTGDGRAAVVVGDEFVALVGVDGGKVEVRDVAEVDGHVESVTRIDGDRFATGHADGAIVRWRAAGGRLERGPEVGRHRDRVYNLAASRDGRWLAAASVDGAARLWPLDAGAPPLEIALPADHFYGLAIHPHGPWLATGGAGVRIWRYRRDVIGSSLPTQ